MSLSILSAAEPAVLRCSEAATGQVALAYAGALKRSRRMRLLTEAMAANLRELRGTEIDRDEIIDFLDMLEELAVESLDDLDLLEDACVGREAA